MVRGDKDSLPFPYPQERRVFAPPIGLSLLSGYRGKRSYPCRVSSRAHALKRSTSVDTLTPRERSERMRLVRSRNTTPEIAVRRLVSKLGHKFRTHCPVLATRPDIVFPSSRRAILVHGCFWHRHSASSCRLARLPKSRLDFWLPKFEANRRRDAAVARRLRRAGWSVMTVWECRLTDTDAVAARVKRFLGRPR